MIESPHQPSACRMPSTARAPERNSSLKPRVGVLGRTEAGEMRIVPQLRAVHRRMNATRVRILTGQRTIARRRIHGTPDTVSRAEGSGQCSSDQYAKYLDTDYRFCNVVVIRSFPPGNLARCPFVRPLDEAQTQWTAMGGALFEA